MHMCIYMSTTHMCVYIYIYVYAHAYNVSVNSHDINGSSKSNRTAQAYVQITCANGYRIQVLMYNTQLPTRCSLVCAMRRS